MKAVTLLLFGASLLFVLLAASAQTAAQAPAPWVDPRFDTQTKAKLEKFFINVDWKKADLAQVLQDLQEKSKKADPDHIGLRFKLNLPADISNLKSHGYPVRREVSIQLTDCPLSDVLGYLSQQTNLVFRAHGGVVTLTVWDAEDQDAAVHAPPQRID